MTGGGARILILVGSSRQESLNRRLAALVPGLRPSDQVETVDDLRSMPFYDGDVEAEGVPPVVHALRERVAAADLLVLVTPEYNGSVPGLLGNALDWLSRPPRRSVLNGKPVVVLSASPRPYGGIRAAQHLREVLSHIGALAGLEGLSVGVALERLLSSGDDPTVAADLRVLLDTAIGSLPEGSPQRGSLLPLLPSAS